jgi:hypothetical protein
VPSRLGLDAQEGLVFFGPVQATCGIARVKRAVLAVAHSVLMIAHAMLKTSQNYRELGRAYLEQVNKDQLPRYFVKRLQRLGLRVSIAPAALAIFEGEKQ